MLHELANDAILHSKGQLRIAERRETERKNVKNLLYSRRLLMMMMMTMMMTDVGSVQHC